MTFYSFNTSLLNKSINYLLLKKVGMHDIDFCRYPIFFNSFWPIADTDIFLCGNYEQLMFNFG